MASPRSRATRSRRAGDPRLISQLADLSGVPGAKLIPPELEALARDAGH